MKRHKYQIAALMMSVIIATGSLSGSVFAVETSEGTEESAAVESSEMSEDIEATEESEASNEDSGQSSDISTEEETAESTEEISQKTDETVEEVKNEDKSEETQDQFVQEEANNNSEEAEGRSDVSGNRSIEDAKTTENAFRTGTEQYVGDEKTSIEKEENEEGQIDSIDEETIILGCGDNATFLSYEYESDTSVSFVIDPNLPVDSRCKYYAYTYTTNVAECLLLPYGSGEGTIKVVEDYTGNTLKIYHIEIKPLNGDVTICKGEYVWTEIYDIPFHESLKWTSLEGVNITQRESEPRDVWVYGEDDFYYQAMDYKFAVKGEMIGDSRASYFITSEDHPYIIINYHVVDHEYRELPITQLATCTEDGLVEKECSNCHDKITETIPATGHIWNEDYTVDKEATCTEEGSESIHCSVCGEIDEETVRSISKKEHAYADWTTTKEATCSEEGSKEKVCTDCGDKVTETIPATGHIWNEDYTVDKEATCTEEGSESIHCSVCDVIQNGTSRTIPKTAHEYGDWTVTKEATCTEAGTKEKTCKDCNDKVTETIPATGHTWNEDYTVDKEATYTEEGSESIHCSICGEIKEGSSRPIARLLKPMSMLTVSGIVDKVYTGNALTQEIVIKDGTTDLIQDTDYTVSYENNTNAGTASVTITGKGNYTGSKTVTFKILPVGWYEEGGVQYFYKSDGTKLTNGWAKNGTAWYWMDNDGKITKNKWIQTGGKWYYMTSSGAMTTGWQQIDGKWYYMNSSGAMTTGWQQIGGKWYYMNSSGAMTTGWQKISGKWYYMNSSGAMTTGWQKIGGKWYYMNSSGAMTTGWQKIGGKWYYMKADGTMATGTQTIGGKTYKFNSSGVWIQ